MARLHGTITAVRTRAGSDGSFQATTTSPPASTIRGNPLERAALASALGMLMGALAGRLLGLVVHQANPRDPAVVVGAVLTMALLGIAASAIPARRALAIDLARLLREE